MAPPPHPLWPTGGLRLPVGTGACPHDGTVLGEEAASRRPQLKPQLLKLLQWKLQLSKLLLPRKKLPQPPKLLQKLQQPKKPLLLHKQKPLPNQSKQKP